MAELCTKHPMEMHAHLCPILNAMSEGIVDVQGSVREASYRFGAQTVVSSISKEAMSPFLSTILAHICWS